MISLPKIISCSSCPCILFCTLCISACNFHLFLPSPEDLLFSPTSPLNFFTILTQIFAKNFPTQISATSGLQTLPRSGRTEAIQSRAVGRKARVSVSLTVPARSKMICCHTVIGKSSLDTRNSSKQSNFEMYLYPGNIKVFTAPYFCFLPHPQSCSLIHICLFINI